MQRCVTKCAASVIQALCRDPVRSALNCHSAIARPRDKHGVTAVVIALCFTAITFSSLAAEPQKCDVYSGKNCQKAADVPADGTKKGAWEVAPADIPKEPSVFKGVGDDVTIDLKLPLEDYVGDDERKILLRDAEIETGKLKVNTKTGAAEFQKPESVTCDYNYFIGKKVDKVELPRNNRVIKPGQPVTQDYSADRVNLHLDNNNIIRDVTCG